MMIAGWMLVTALATGAGSSLQDARDAFSEGKLKVAAEHAEAAHKQAPSEREALDMLAAIYDVLKDEKRAKPVYKKLKSLPKVVDPPAEPPPPPVAATPGEKRFVNATRLRLRLQPEPDATVAGAVVINTPVIVRKVEDGQWVEVIPTGADAEWQRGYVNLSFLSQKPITVEELLPLAEAHEKAGRPVDATRVLARAWALKPGDATVGKKLLRVAVAGKQFQTAADVAAQLDSSLGLVRAPSSTPPPPLLSKAAFKAQDGASFSMPLTQHIDDGEEMEESTDTIACKRVGSLTSGPYKGHALAFCRHEYPYKPSGPGETEFFRAAVAPGDKSVAILLRMSDPIMSKEKDVVMKACKRGFKNRCVFDDTWQIDDMRPHPVIFQDADVRVVYMFHSSHQKPDATAKALFEHKSLGKVLPGSEDGTLLVAQPDGGSFVYAYERLFRDSEVQWTDAAMPKGETVSVYRWGCEIGAPEQLATAAFTDVDESQLTPAGKLHDKPVFAPKPPLLKRLHDQYARDEGKLALDAYSKARPVWFWKDPFGAFRPFHQKAMIPAPSCEPIVYLYPERTTGVIVRLGDDVKVRVSVPRHEENTWKVLAHPDGRLVDNRGRAHRYLFWEGSSLIVDKPAEGWVISRDEVPAFLRKVLPELGLSPAEISLFISAWAPKLSHSPYVFIAFHERSTIDSLAPMQVQPEPDTIIRVLMDFEPLDAPRDVREPTLPGRPERKGFTVVEWGGLGRR